MGGVRAGFGALVAGVLLAQLVPDTPARWGGALAGGAAAAAVAAVVLARRSREALRREGRREGPHAVVATALGLTAVALGGAAAGRARLDAALHRPLPPGHVARRALPLRASLSGTVVGLPAERPDGTVVLLEADGVDGAPAEGRVRVRIRGRVPKLRPGDLLAMPATLRRPRGFANPGSFDVAGHLARRGILVTASVWDPAVVRRRSRPAGGVGVRLARWRQRLVRTAALAAPGAEGAVLAALVVGVQDGIPEPLREAFARAGVVHVLSVSGLHVGIVGAVGFGLLRAAGLRVPWLVRRVDVRALAAAGSLPAVAGYAALAGLEVATLRSTIMAAAAALALLAGRQADVLRTLGAAAVVLALAWPGSPREIGFQLSCTSVLAIVVGVRRFAPGRPVGLRGRARLAGVVSLAAAIGTAPLVAYHFQQLSLVAPLANPLVIPLFGAVVVVAGLASAAVEPFAPALAARGFALAGTLVHPGAWLVDRLGTLPWAAVRVPAPDAVELAVSAVLVLAPAVLRGRALRAATGVALVVLAGDAARWVRTRAAPDRLRVTFLDVGQGDAAVAELPGGAVVVVDAGGFPGSGFDPGTAVIAPFLATRKILTLDAVAATHAHPDHFGGLASLLPMARELWWNGHPGRGAEWDRFRAAVGTAAVAERVLHAGATLPRSARGVEVLHPPAGWVGSLNDGSLVLALRHGGVAVLLTGDAEAGAEAALLAGDRLLRALVLKVPHHGSRTSSTPAFLDAVRPAIAVVPVGADNRYGLPAPDVEARYRTRGICVLRTDRCGAVSIETDGAALRVWTHLGCRCPDAGADAVRATPPS